MEFGDILKTLRTKHGLSIDEVAKRVGVSKTHLWQLEAGRTQNPTLELLKKLAEVFEVSISHLVGESLPGELDQIVVYRDMKSLKKNDQELVHLIIKALIERSS